MLSGHSLSNVSSTALRVCLIVSVASPSASAGQQRCRNQQSEKLESAEKKDRAQLGEPTGVRNRVPQYRVEGNGPLLIYISGLDATGELFFKQAPALACSYRVVTFRSRDSGRFTYDDLAGDVADIIRDQREERATIVAESFGGGVALTLALRYPAMVERLVIVNSFARFKGRIQIKLAILFAWALPFWLTSTVRKAANNIALRKDGVEREDTRRFFKVIRTVKRAGYLRRLRIIATLNLENRLSEIQSPALFIAGEEDLLIPSAREARSMAARMPNAQVRIIPRAGHACLLGNRVRLAEILTEWTGQ